MPEVAFVHAGHSRWALLLLHALAVFLGLGPLSCVNMASPTERWCVWMGCERHDRQAGSW